MVYLHVAQISIPYVIRFPKLIYEDMFNTCIAGHTVDLSLSDHVVAISAICRRKLPTGGQQLILEARSLYFYRLVIIKQDNFML